MKELLADRRTVDQIWLALFAAGAAFLLAGWVLSGTLATVDTALGTVGMAAAGMLVIAHFVLARRSN